MAHVDELLLIADRCFHSPDVFAECGFPDPWLVAEQVWNQSRRRAEYTSHPSFALGLVDASRTR
ncbi:hypothetical protein ACFQZ4_43420 [Catellatospora coxensis]